MSLAISAAENVSVLILHSRKTKAGIILIGTYEVKRGARKNDVDAAEIKSSTTHLLRKTITEVP